MKVAIVGATGMVGQVMLKVLAERNFPVTSIIPVASEKSIGKEIEFKENTLTLNLKSFECKNGIKPTTYILKQKQGFLIK